MNYLEFLESPAFSRFLDSCWDAGRNHYCQSDGAAASSSVSLQAAVYHTYLALMTGEELHRQRVAGLLANTLRLVREDGSISESIDKEAPVDHPGFTFTIAKCLGIIYPYLDQLGLEALREAVRKAILTIVERNPEAGEAGTHGSDQSLRFELPAYYFAYHVSGDRKYLDWYTQLFNNGIISYTRDIHSHKIRHFTEAPGLQRAGLHPDFTFNYAGGVGTVDSLPTNTHTPAYYLTEVDGFLFTYLHGLKNGILQQNSEWDEFCVKYATGLYKDLSRAGRMSCDVDGYGIHRAWYAKVIFEGLPLTAAAPWGPNLELGEEARRHFKWYSDRFIKNFMSSEDFRQYGVPPHQPYGHRLTIEKQFDRFNCIEIYAKVALNMYELGVEQVEALEPGPFYAYSWWHNWVRVSTPVYETSFVATTGGCNIPRAKYFGDPNLGTLAGGSALTTLFAGPRLLYAPVTDPDYAFDMMVQDRNGHIARSSCTEFGDEVQFYVEDAKGERIEKESFQPYGMPHVRALDGGVKTVFKKTSDRPQAVFVVQNRFGPDEVEITQKFFTPAGCFLKKGIFGLPVSKLEPLKVEFKDGSRRVCRFEEEEWLDIREVRALESKVNGAAWRIEPVRVPPYRHEKNTRLWSGSEGLEGEPGGENSFCPYPMGVIRIGLGGEYLNQAELVLRISFKDDSVIG